MTELQLCECGCGELAKPGNRFLSRHFPRTQRKGQKKYQPIQGRCPRCDQVVTLREDGSPSAHWIVQGQAEERYRCPQGTPRRRSKTRTGRRARVSINVVIPLEMSRGEFAAIARRALVDALDAAFVVAVEVAESGSADVPTTDGHDCYCCTCDGEWDAACRNHGAHGVRPCERHGNGSPEDLICGCGCVEPTTGGGSDA